MARRQPPHLRHSERAKKNSRDGINLRIGVIEARVAGIKKEIKLYERFAHSAFAQRVLRVLRHRKLPTRLRQLARYKRRKARLQREGKI